jgi:maltooligosyltrehalose trehalohydrolase
LAPETPLVFMGQEWGASSPFLFFTDHEENLGRGVSENRRKELAAFTGFSRPAADKPIPDPQARSTFARSRLGWPEREREPHAGRLRLYRRALALRRELGLGSLERGEYRVSGEDGELVLEVTRTGVDPVLVVVRLGGPGILESDGEEPAASDAGPPWRVLLTTESEEFTSEPRPLVVGPGSARPRITFRRAGAVVLTKSEPW